MHVWLNQEAIWINSSLARLSRLQTHLLPPLLGWTRPLAPHGSASVAVMKKSPSAYMEREFPWTWDAPLISSPPTWMTASFSRSRSRRFSASRPRLLLAANCHRSSCTSAAPSLITWPSRAAESWGQMQGDQPCASPAYMVTAVLRSSKGRTNNDLFRETTK